MKYRVSIYRDGNRKLIYRPEKWTWWWPFWSSIEIMEIPEYSFVLEFGTEQGAREWIDKTTTENAARKRQRVRNRVA